MITVEQARRHWFADRGSYCMTVQQIRDEAWRIYESMKHLPGRRQRGRQLSRLNHALCVARYRCRYCSQDVLWEYGSVVVSPYKNGDTWEGGAPWWVLKGMARG